MALAQVPAPQPSVHVPEPRPSDPPSTFARARSETLRWLAVGALPRSILFAHGPRHARGKRVALTFDDGPDAMTPAYLDVLDRLGVRATFFLIGENALRAGDLVAEYVRRGHELGGHGWTHESFASMAPARLASELTHTQAVLPSGHGQPRLVRPPRGALSAGALMRLAAGGYATVLWSLDSDDCRTRDPVAVARRVSPENVANGDVVLLHETQTWTIQALPGIVGSLRSAGYEFATVGELMGGRHGRP